MKLSFLFNRRSRVWLFPLLLVMSFPLWQRPFSAFLAIQVKNDQTGDAKRGQRLQMEDIVLRQFSNGRLDLQLTAASVANNDRELEVYNLKEVNCRLVDEQGRVTTITGGEGLFASAQEIVTIVDNVELVAEQGRYRLQTDALRYLPRYQVLKSATPVHIFADDSEIHGDTMMYNQRIGEFRVTGNVSCRL